MRGGMNVCNYILYILYTYGGLNPSFLLTL